jgi:hypothetical protein
VRPAGDGSLLVGGPGEQAGAADETGHASGTHGRRSSQERLDGRPSGGPGGHEDEGEDGEASQPPMAHGSAERPDDQPLDEQPRDEAGKAERAVGDRTARPARAPAR